MLKPFCDVCGKLIEKPFSDFEIRLPSLRPAQAGGTLDVALTASVGRYDLCMFCAFDQIQVARQRCFASPAEEAE